MAHAQETFRACIVDDHELIRDGLRMLLVMSGEFEVVDVASDAARGRELLLREQPDVAIVDVWLPDGSGLELIRSVRARAPQVMCLAMTSYPSTESFRDAVRAGASGYVSKDVPNATLLEALHRIANGGTVLGWTDAEADRDSPTVPAPHASDLIEALTPRERRILDLITEGRTNREIASELFLAEKTVRNYVSNLLGKLGLRNRTQAATMMVSHGGRHASIGGQS